jgi:hypothetical protein
LTQQTFYLKVGDTSPALKCSVLPKTVDLTGATVQFSMRASPGGAIKVNKAAAAVVTATVNPAVSYDWQAANVDTEGEFDAEFLVTYPGGKKETFPNSEFIKVIIGPRAA